MEERPWIFDNHQLVLKQMDGYAQPTPTRFDNEVFWLQFFNLPIICMNCKYGNLIGESLGTILDIDVKGDGTGWGWFLRVHV